MDVAGRDGAAAPGGWRESVLSRALSTSQHDAQGLRPSQVQGVSPGFDQRPATPQLRPRCAWAIPHPLRPITRRTKTKPAKLSLALAPARGVPTFRAALVQAG